MNMKMLLLGAATATFVSGAAYAAGGNTTALDDKEMMGPFYTDSTMATMKTGDEFKVAWLALSDEDRGMLQKECAASTIAPKHDVFCNEMAKELGGNK